MSALLRPRFASYLPPSYEATGRSAFARLVDLYESVLSGSGSTERRLFEVRATLAALDPALATALAAARDISYDAATLELVYRGEMSATRRTELEALADGVAAVPRASYLAALESLFTQSWSRAAPRHLLETWAELRVGTMMPTLLGALAAFPDVRYDAVARRLAFSGSMSIARRDALRQVGPAAGLAGAALADYDAAIVLLFGRAREREELVPGVEQLLDDIQRFSDPLAAPAPSYDTPFGSAGFFDADFVSFLASWVAVSVKQEWPEARKRRLIASIVPIYKKRGTLDGIRTLLEIYVDAPVTITERLGMQIGERSTIDVDALIGGLPHQFAVEIPFGFRDPGTPPRPIDFALLRRVTDAVREVLDLEKPVHTDYTAGYRFPGIIVGEYSTVRVDTLIWDDVLDVTELNLVGA